MSQPDNPSPATYYVGATSRSPLVNFTATPAPTPTPTTGFNTITTPIFPTLTSNVTESGSPSNSTDSTGRSNNYNLLSNASYLFYFIAAFGLICAIFYTIHSSRRDRKNRRRQQNESQRRETERQQPFTYRPNSGDDEASPPQYFAHELDQPYVGPETMMLYADDVLYGGQVPVPAAEGAPSGDAATATTSTNATTQLLNNSSSAARVASPASSSDSAVVINVPSISAPSPALSLDGHSTTLDPIDNNNVDNNGRRRVTFGRHSIAIFSPRRLLHRRGSSHSSSSSASLHRSSSRLSQQGRRQGSASSSVSSSSMETATRPDFQRTSSSISSLVNSLQVPQPAMVETNRMSYPPVLYRLRSQGPPPYVADVRPEDAPPLPPDYSAVVSNAASSTSPSSPSPMEEEHVAVQMPVDDDDSDGEERLVRPRRA